MSTNKHQLHGDDDEKNEADLAHVSLSDDDLPEESVHVDEIEVADPLLAEKMQEENEELLDFMNPEDEDPSDWT